MHMPTPLNLVVIMAVVLLVFGPNKLPEIARAMAKAMNEFKGAMRDVTQHFDLEAMTAETRVHSGSSGSGNDSRALPGPEGNAHPGDIRSSYPHESSSYDGTGTYSPVDGHYMPSAGTISSDSSSQDQGINQSIVVG